MKTVIKTDKAPAAVGPYSQAVRVDNMLYLSGQIPLVPETGVLVEGDIRVQTARVFENIKAVLSEAGGDFSNVVKTLVFLTDIQDFAAVNEVY